MNRFRSGHEFCSICQARSTNRGWVSSVALGKLPYTVSKCKKDDSAASGSAAFLLIEPLMIDNSQVPCDVACCSLDVASSSTGSTNSADRCFFYCSSGLFLEPSCPPPAWLPNIMQLRCVFVRLLPFAGMLSTYQGEPLPQLSHTKHILRCCSPAAAGRGLMGLYSIALQQLL